MSGTYLNVVFKPAKDRSDKRDIAEISESFAIDGVTPTSTTNCHDGVNDLACFLVSYDAIEDFMELVEKSDDVVSCR